MLFHEFATSINDQVPIIDLYMRLTEEKFTLEDKRLRAKPVWRKDASATLTYFQDHNILIDFVEATAKNSDIGGTAFTPIFLVQAVKNFTYIQAIVLLCNMYNIEFPPRFDDYLPSR